MGRPKAKIAMPKIYSQLKVTPGLTVSAVSFRCGPFRRDRLRGRSPEDAILRGGSEFSVRPEVCGHNFWHFVWLRPGRWQCHREMRQYPSSRGPRKRGPRKGEGASTAWPVGLSRSEKIIRPWVRASFERTDSSPRSPHRLPDRP